MGAPTGAGYDAAASAYFARAGTLSDGRKALINALVLALKANGTWAKRDALWLIANETSAAGFKNLIRDDHHLTQAGTGTFTADRGWAGNGSTGFLHTDFISSTDFIAGSVNSNHLEIYNRTNRTTSNAFSDFAAYDDTRLWSIQCSYANQTYMRNFNVDASVGAAATAQGYWVNNRSAAGATQHYRNASALTPLTGASNGLLAIELYIGASNHAGTAEEFNTDQYAMAGIGASLSAAEVTADQAVIEAYMDAIGAGVI